MTCFERLLRTLRQVESLEIQFSRSKVDGVVEILDGLNGTEGFIIFAEQINGNEILLLTKMFEDISGPPEKVVQAYEYLFDTAGDGHGVSISRNRDTGAIAAVITFRCEVESDRLKIDLMHYLCTLTTFMETYYEAIFLHLKDLGVLAIKSHKT